jgi:hypothetical protein
MKKLMLLAGLALPHTLLAQDANAVRGGWVTDADGRMQIYMLIVRGTAVTGTYCVDCTDPQNLSYVVDGHLEGGGVRFTLRHESAHGKVTLDDVRGELAGKELVLTLQSKGASPSKLTLHRPAPSPNVLAFTNDEMETQGLTMRSRPPYVLPGAREPVTPDKVVGLWLWGTGPGKQYFIIQRVGSQVLGMVCGPCENPNNMAPLDGFVFDGTNLTFNIVHEDTGAAVQHGPFNNVAHGTLSRNELHIKVIPSYDPPDSKPFEMTLLGPTAFQPPPH